MTARAVALSALLLAGCDMAAPVIAPIIETPPAGDDAYPYDGVNVFQLSVARAGDEVDLVAAAIPAGEPLALDGVTASGELVVHLSARRAGDELAYGRTCTLMADPGEAPIPSQPRLWLSRVVTWGPATAPDGPARVGAHGVGFAGDALLLGGLDATGEPVTEVERFDALRTGRFASVATTLARIGGAVAAFRGGRLLLVGGADADGAPVTSVEVLDPGAAAREVTTVAGGPALRDHRAVSLVDGSVLVVGGREGEAGEVSASAWRYRLADGLQLETADPSVPGLAVARAEHSLTRLSDEVGADVVVIGGRDAAGMPVAQVELYRPLRERFELVEGAQLARWGHQAIRLPGGFVLVVGGYELDPTTGETVPARTPVVYDPVQGEFLPASRPLPANAGLTELTATALADGRVLLVGGKTLAGEPTSAALIARLDPLNGEVNFVPTAALAEPRAGHAAVALCDGTILVTGGGPTTAERYNPSSQGRR